MKKAIIKEQVEFKFGQVLRKGTPVEVTKVGKKTCEVRKSPNLIFNVPTDNLEFEKEEFLV